MVADRARQTDDVVLDRPEARAAQARDLSGPVGAVVERVLAVAHPEDRSRRGARRVEREPDDRPRPSVRGLDRVDDLRGAGRPVGGDREAVDQPVVGRGVELAVGTDGDAREHLTLRCRQRHLLEGGTARPAAAARPGPGRERAVEGKERRAAEVLEAVGHLERVAGARVEVRGRLDDDRVAAARRVEVSGDRRTVAAPRQPDRVRSQGRGVDPVADVRQVHLGGDGGIPEAAAGAVGGGDLRHRRPASTDVVDDRDVVELRVDAADGVDRQQAVGDVDGPFGGREAVVGRGLEPGDRHLSLDPDPVGAVEVGGRVADRDLDRVGAVGNLQLPGGRRLHRGPGRRGRVLHVDHRVDRLVGDQVAVARVQGQVERRVGGVAEAVLADPALPGRVRVGSAGVGREAGRDRHPDGLEVDLLVERRRSLRRPGDGARRGPVARPVLRDDHVVVGRPVGDAAIDVARAGQRRPVQRCSARPDRQRRAAVDVVAGEVALGVRIPAQRDLAVTGARAHVRGRRRRRRVGGECLDGDVVELRVGPSDRVDRQPAVAHRHLHRRRLEPVRGGRDERVDRDLALDPDPVAAVEVRRRRRRRTRSPRNPRPGPSVPRPPASSRRSRCRQPGTACGSSCRATGP